MFTTEEIQSLEAGKYASYLRRCQEKVGLNKVQIAAMVGVKPPTVGQWTTGDPYRSMKAEYEQVRLLKEVLKADSILFAQALPSRLVLTDVPRHICGNMLSHIDHSGLKLELEDPVSVKNKSLMELRKAAGLGKAELARRTGVTTPRLTAAERDEGPALRCTVRQMCQIYEELGGPKVGIPQFVAALPGVVDLSEIPGDILAFIFDGGE